jgi:RimJ/RimL family protein N-acetyltransferase
MISYDNHWGPIITHYCGSHFNPECDTVVARTRWHDNEEILMGGSVFQNYTEESIAIHVASFEPNWINRDLLFATFGYPFLQLEVQRIFGQVAADNAAALTFDLHLGFREIARIPKVFQGGVDDVVMCMERTECRFLRRPRSMQVKLAA